MDVMLSGIVSNVRPLQPEKASSPMDVTLFGLDTDVRLLQSEKAVFLIVEQPSEMDTEMMFFESGKTSDNLNILGIITDVRLPQMENVDLPMDVTLCGRLTDVSSLQ